MSLLRRVPRAGLLCALAATLNAAAWGLITPAFHVPDEPQHIAYVQHLAETGELPGVDRRRREFSSEESTVFEGVRFSLVAGNDRGRPPWEVGESRALESRMHEPLSRRDGGGPTNATSNPPLYYALEALPYRAGASGTFLDRLALMRLLSALLAGATVLFCFAFLRELLPGTPWAWSAGALAVAFQPVFGFVGGGVSPDNLLFVTAAATFYLLARAFRRGLTPHVALALGAAVGAGLLTKGTTLGLIPGIGLGLVFLVWRAGPGSRAAARRGAAIAAGVAAAFGLAYLLLSNSVWEKPLYAGAGTVVTRGTDQARSVLDLVQYAWQFYLPRPPFMEDQWRATYPLYDVWLKGFVGRFGWLDYGFPAWVNTVGAGLFLTMAGLAVSTLVHGRARLRSRWLELATYVAITLGLLALIAIVGYGYRIDTGNIFEQTRYLFPLLPLYGALVALAARAAGPKWGPALGWGIVLLTIGHGLFAQLLTLSRYYG